MADTAEHNDELIRVANLHVAAARALARRKFGMVFDRADRTRDRWDSRWIRELTPIWPKPEYGADIDALVAAGQEEWSRVEKGPYWDAIRLAARKIFGRVKPFAEGSNDKYLELARDTSEDAGQHVLDTLGLNTTFRWTTQEDLPRNLFAVRGSKVIQVAYGNHLDDLRQIVLDATNPQEPKTQNQIRREITEKWDELSRSQVERISRTESAAVWESMNYNTARANEVQEFDWLVAHGPSIGGAKSLPVCKRCLRMAAGGPYKAGAVELPPKHPHCRCTLIPRLADDWLPPREPWTGDVPPVDLLPLEAP